MDRTVPQGEVAAPCIYARRLRRPSRGSALGRLATHGRHSDAPWRARPAERPGRPSWTVRMQLGARSLREYRATAGVHPVYGLKAASDA